MIALQFLPMHAKTIGDRLLQARQAANLTQDQLAARCHISRSLISQWENGIVQEISASKLYAAARALHVSLDWLLEGDDIKPASNIPHHMVMDEDISADWIYLTARQKEEIKGQIRAIAAENRALFEELSRQT